MTTVTLRRTALLDAMQDSYSHSSTSMNRGRPLLRKVATCITLFCLCIPSCSHELTFLLCSNFGSGVVNRKFGKMSDSKQSRHPVRVRNVRILRRVASEHGVAAVPDNAARKRVEKLGEDLLAVQLEESDAQAVRQALKDYQATFRTAEVSGEAEEPKRAERSEADENQREWKFSAVQLTYNGSHGGFVGNRHRAAPGFVFALHGISQRTQVGFARSRDLCHYGKGFSRASPLACLFALVQAVSQERERSVGCLCLRRHTTTCGAE